MKTAIIYCSKHGTTEKVARLIGELLEEKVDYFSVKNKENISFQDYEKIILGTSIYAGSPGNEMTKFCIYNQSALQQKKVGLFICCMNQENSQEQMKKAFPEYLHEVAVAEEIMGGEFLFEKMNFIERFIVKKIVKIKASVSNIDKDSITGFSKRMMAL